MNRIQKQTEYFDLHKEEIQASYMGKAIVIPESLEIKPFSTLEEGYRYGVKEYGYGNFLLKDCANTRRTAHVVSPTIRVVS